MKPAAFTGVLVLFATISAKTQLSFLPQLGIDRTKTSVSNNNAPSFSPMGTQGNFKANLRADYRFKKRHGPYAGIGTAPGAVAFNFTDASNVSNGFTATQNALQLKLEGGYQYTSRPINFKKSKQSSAKTSSNTEVKRSCGSYYKSYRQKTSNATSTAKQNNNLNLRLQPSLGIAYLPSTKDDLLISNSGYQYNAGNYKTALTPAMGFEFARGKQRLFTLSLFYLTPLDKNEEQSIKSISNDKITNNIINSNTSSWGLMLGVPFSISKKQKTIAPAVKTEPAKQYKSKCQSYYRSGCIRRL